MGSQGNRGLSIDARGRSAQRDFYLTPVDSRMQRMVRESLSAMSLLAATVLATPGGAQARTPGDLQDPARCGTVDLLDQRHELEAPLPLLVPAKAAPEACTRNPRPSYDDEEVYDDDTYKFRIHYTTDPSDDRSVTLNQVEQTAKVMRDTIDAEGTDGLGYPMPPDDEIDSQVYCDEGYGGNGGNGYYDVYFVDEDNIYGYARPMSIVPGTDNQATSHLALSTWILDYAGALEVTVAHEFFHAIQFRYDVYENGFWMENTAVWMEEQVYDDINDYLNYVPEAFQNPGTPLDEEKSIQYAHGIWPLYMSQVEGQDVIMEIWDTCADVEGENALRAQKAVLDDEYTGGWAQAVLDFRGAMYNKEEFAEGDLYTSSVDVRELVTVYPAEDTLSVDHTGGDFIVFGSPTSGDGTLQLCFSGAKAEAIAKVFVRDQDDNRDEIAVEGDANSFSVSVPGLGDSVKQVALVVTYATTSDATSNYTYSASIGDTPCTPGEGGEPTDPDATPTEGTGGIDDEVVYGCGGCVVVEEEASRSNAAGAWMAGSLLAAVFVLRRRRS